MLSGGAPGTYPLEVVTEVLQVLSVELASISPLYEADVSAVAVRCRCI